MALAWQTASETASAYFEVARSADGRQFAAVAQVAAAGTSPTTHHYAYLDRGRSLTSSIITCAK